MTTPHLSRAFHGCDTILLPLTSGPSAQIRGGGLLWPRTATHHLSRLPAAVLSRSRFCKRKTPQPVLVRPFHQTLRAPSGRRNSNMNTSNVLVPLDEVERLSPYCIRILGGNPSNFTLQGTNTYLLGSGDKRILIDTAEGRPSWKAALASVLEREKATVSAVLLTHWHGDHVGGMNQVLELCPDAVIYKNRPDEKQRDIYDGQRFEVQGAAVKALYTPGHTNDHMAFLSDDDGTMFTGDNVLGQGTAVFEDLSSYMKSLEKMKSLARAKGFPGHGPVLDDVSATISQYISHRQQRESQVLDALASPNNARGKSSSWSTSELVDVIYDKLPPAVHMAACGGIQQILEKLEKEGRAKQDKQNWRL